MCMGEREAACVLVCLCLRFCEMGYGCLLSGCCPRGRRCALHPADSALTHGLCLQCQIIYPRQQLLTLRELEMIGFIENNVSKLSLLLSEISRCELTSFL